MMSSRDVAGTEPTIRLICQRCKPSCLSREMPVSLEQLLNDHQWEEAINFVATGATSDSSILDYIHQLRWYTEGPSLQAIHRSLAVIKNSTWVIETCLSTISDSLDVNEALVALGQERLALLMSKPLAQEPSPAGASDLTHGLAGKPELQRALEILADRRQRLDTFRLWTQVGTHPEITSEEPEDPWADLEPDNIESEEASRAAHTPASVVSFYREDTPPVFLPAFIGQPLLQVAIQLAASIELEALRDLVTRHSEHLREHRFEILDAIPPHISPADYQDLLPEADPLSGNEALPTGNLWLGGRPLSTRDGLLSPSDLSHWYVSKVTQIDSMSGLVGTQLAFIQHGAARGVGGLDALGEDLSLLSKMVYDTGDTAVDWSLSRWQRAPSSEIVQGYLGNSTAASIVKDIRRLVLPYLYVLESRAERAGQPSGHIVEEHLNHIILSSSLPFVLPLFEASKATLPVEERLIKHDLDVARLALACLYGSSAKDQWNTMSSIFECLPVWEIVSDDQDDQDAAATTLESLGAFVRPSTSQIAPPVASDMYLFFSPLPFASLSRALDILDVHLESGELLSKWGIPCPLRFFVQSAGDAEEQRACAVRMARGAVSEIGSMQEWEALLADMLKLCGGGDGLLRGAFGALSRQEVLGIFLEGLLASTNFEIARKLLKASPLHELPFSVVEDITLKISREFYDNAEQGNLHSGNMRFAYTCLDVIPITAATRQDKEFIEATSRILSYNIRSNDQNQPITPLEIRQARNRLDIIGQVLASSEGAYRHESVIMDIVDKLGYRNNQFAHISVMCKLVDLAIQAGDNEQAHDLCQKLLRTIGQLRSSSSDKGDAPNQTLQQAYERCWRTFTEVAVMPGLANEDKGVQLLAAAIRLCPPAETGQLLEQWRAAEERNRPERPDWTRRDDSYAALRTEGIDHSAPTVLLGSRRAARAAQMAVSFSEHLAGRLPLSDIPQDGVQVSRNAKLALAKGVGWLLGENDGGR